MVASDVTRDGSPVAVYLALPASPKFDPVLNALPGNGSVLDLGCGTGRLSNLLAELGYEVVAVDESPALLTHVTDSVESVRGRIEGLELGRRFDAVVLAGNLINTAELEQRTAFLGTVRRHLHDEGQAFIQRYDPDWAFTVVEHDGAAGQVRVHLEVDEHAGPVFTATSTFRLKEQSWVQRFRTRVVDDEEMRSALGAAGLKLDSWLTSRWAAATMSPLVGRRSSSVRRWFSFWFTARLWGPTLGCPSRRSFANGMPLWSFRRWSTTGHSPSGGST